MAIPWKILERAPTPDGLLELRQRGPKDFQITLGGMVLMNSAANRSEEALGKLACTGLQAPAPRTLVAGLGLGFTLRSMLDALPAGAHVIAVPCCWTGRRGLWRCCLCKHGPGRSWDGSPGSRPSWGIAHHPGWAGAAARA